MADQFDTHLRCLEIAPKHPTVGGYRDALAAAGISANDDEPISGFWRLPFERGGVPQPLGTWLEDDDLTLVVQWGPEYEYSYRRGSKDEPWKQDLGQRQLALRRIWPWALDHPVARTLWADVMNGAQWPDVDDALARLKEAERYAGAGNNPPEAIDPAEALTKKLSAIVDVTKYKVINDADAEKAAGDRRTTLLGYVREAEAELKTAREPLDKQIKALKAIWDPIIDRAQASADVIRFAAQAYRERLLAAQRERDRIAREEAEKARLEHARQILEHARQVAEAEAKNRPPPPPPEAPPEVPPSEPVGSDYVKGPMARGGMRVSAPKEMLDQITDRAAVFAHFNYFEDEKTINKTVVIRINQALKAGVKVPGITTKEGVSVT